ncbi:MAG: AEC family transporter [Clostridia bacterium]|nr:AEC family transporter [Clostridia bacterium]
MLQNLITVALQVAMLFIMIAVGFALGKTKLLNEKAVKGLANVVLYVATPAVILQAFTIEAKTPEKTKNLIIVAVITIVLHVVMILLAKLLIRNKDDRANRIMRLLVIFSNSGYMAFPLQKAILGDIGVFYGAMFVAIFNIFMWTYAIFVASGDKKNLSIKRVILNPTIISVIVSILLYAFSIKLPGFISDAVSGLGNLNTPLPMIIIGFNISCFPFIQLFNDKRVYFPGILRLIVMPLLSLGIMLLLGVRGLPLIACTVAASAPSAAAPVMFATKYGLDAQLGSKITSLTTLFSILTMPVIVALAQAI